ncbi:AAEL004609-PA [Aedes aegypti]|uniref:AAEL004609-PA n=1 Tax=Aedes aegypti TaxID=7159 RepID=Q17CD5_AEDAE|nr:AAEL004609-PA [Aedes aegypti]
MTRRGRMQLSVNGYLYTRDKTRGDSQFWACNQSKVLNCTARATTHRTQKNGPPRITLRGQHNHEVITERRKSGARARLIEKCRKDRITFVLTKRGSTQLSVNGFLYMRNKARGITQFWACNQHKVLNCTARATTRLDWKDTAPKVSLRGFHNHAIIHERRKAGQRARLLEQYISFVISKRGKTQLCVDGYLYMRVKATEEMQYWSCNQFRVLGCTARATTGRGKRGDKPVIKLRGFHNHQIILERRKPGECAKLKEQYAREREVLPERRKWGGSESQQLPSYQPPAPLPVPIEQCFLKKEK